MPMGAGSPARQGVQEEHRHIHVAVIGADKLMRAADEREILLADAVQGCRCSWLRPRL
jgi:hypothetical protein